MAGGAWILFLQNLGGGSLPPNVKLWPGPYPRPYNVGDVATLQVTFTDAQSGEMYDPGAVALTVADPSGTKTFPDVTRLDTGIYQASLLLPRAGAWLYEWNASGDKTGAAPGSLFVEEAAFG